MTTDRSAKADLQSDDQDIRVGPKPKLYGVDRKGFELRFEDEADLDNFGVGDDT